MNKPLRNRLTRLEKVEGVGNGIKKCFMAMWKLPRHAPPGVSAPIPPEMEVDIRNAFSQLSEEEVAILSEICSL